MLGIDQKGSKNQKVVCAVEINNSASEQELEELKEKMRKIGQDLPKGTKITDFYFCRKKLPIANNMKVKRFVVKNGIESQSGDYISFDYKKEKKSTRNFDQKTVTEVLEPMRAIFSKILILPSFKIDDDGHWVDDLGGDSMSYVELITNVQDHFGVTIPEELYGKLATLNDFVEEVAKLRGKK